MSTSALFGPMDDKRRLPYDGDLQAAVRAQDREAVRALMSAGDVAAVRRWRASKRSSAARMPPARTRSARSATSTCTSLASTSAATPSASGACTRRRTASGAQHARSVARPFSTCPRRASRCISSAVLDLTARIYNRTIRFLSHSNSPHMST